ncbi:hypothetical protein OIU74_013580 [Salix koriyanagi]|uniref:RNA helicase aquarius N-terminal domain-containing protein n=1 Tax=Salix koriyanagi TaxID=2511006 RepID=A0A9Q0Q9G1_9ROSI|nr:hypothetical protein OIU74_013580 [Salix koriyanagi]
MLLKLQKVSNVYNFFRYYFIEIDHSNTCSLTSRVSASDELVRYAKVMGKLFARHFSTDGKLLASAGHDKKSEGTYGLFVQGGIPRPLVADVAVVAKCHLSALYRHEKGKLFAQLVDLLQFYERAIAEYVSCDLTSYHPMMFLLHRVALKLLMLH